MEFLVLGLGADLAPELGIQPGECLGGEPPEGSGGLVLGDQGRLDGNGAAAAEAIPQELPAPVVGQHDHSRRQCLPQRRIVAIGPIAPLVKPRSRSVQIELDPIVHNGELELILGPRLRQPVHTVLLPQTAGCRLFHNGLAVRHAHELAVQAVALHREYTVSRDVILQVGLVHPLEKLLEGGGLEVCQHDQHPLAGAQTHVGLGQGQTVSGKQHPAVFHPDILHVQPSQLVPCQALQAKEAGYGKFHFVHRLLSFSTVSTGLHLKVQGSPPHPSRAAPGPPSPGRRGLFTG